MRKHPGCIAVLMALCASAGAQGQLESRQLLDGRITMQVPADFAPMPAEMLVLKYPGANRPSVVLTDESTTVNLAMDHKPVPVQPEQLKDLEPVMRQQLSQARINSGGIRELNGHPFLVFDMDTPAVDGTIRNVMAMSSLEGRLLVVSYNCLVSKDPDCGALGTKLIESIKVIAR